MVMTISFNLTVNTTINAVHNITTNTVTVDNNMKGLTSAENSLLGYVEVFQPSHLAAFESAIGLVNADVNYTQSTGLQGNLTSDEGALYALINTGVYHIGVIGVENAITHVI
jgi:hypothetical protein